MQLAKMGLKVLRRGEWPRDLDDRLRELFEAALIQPDGGDPIECVFAHPAFPVGRQTSL